jgi:hypothetical protein
MVGYPLSGRRASLVERRLCEAETGRGLSRVGPLSELAVFLDTAAIVTTRRFEYDSTLKPCTLRSLSPSPKICVLRL